MWKGVLSQRISGGRRRGVLTWRCVRGFVVLMELQCSGVVMSHRCPPRLCLQSLNRARARTMALCLTRFTTCTRHQPRAHDFIVRELLWLKRAPGGTVSMHAEEMSALLRELLCCIASTIQCTVKVHTVGIDDTDRKIPS